MSKRFTDTEIWEKEWFSELTPRLKCAVRYLFDRCDIAGIWSPNLKLMSAYIGEGVTEQEILSIDAGRQFKKLPGGKIFIQDFVLFQAGEVLNPAVGAHRKIINLLTKHGLPIPYKKNKDTLSDGVRGTQQEEEVEGEEEKEKGVQGDFENVPEVNQVREELQTYFGVTEQTMPEQWRQIGHFATTIHHRQEKHKTLDHFWKQHKAYKLYKENNPTFNGYGLTNYLGTGPKYFMDGGWNKENWELKNKKNSPNQTPTKVKLGK